jgi:translation initiation factor 1
VRAAPPSAQAPRVRRERGGRKGKTVTVAGPLLLAREAASGLLRELKRGCGVGGTIKLGRTPSGEPCYDLELQGDHVDRLVERLRALGYPARRAGG